MATGHGMAPCQEGADVHLLVEVLGSQGLGDGGEGCGSFAEEGGEGFELVLERNPQILRGGAIIPPVLQGINVGDSEGEGVGDGNWWWGLWMACRLTCVGTGGRPSNGGHPG